jgi:putative ABC transport system ATP-binding protein
MRTVGRSTESDADAERVTEDDGVAVLSTAARSSSLGNGCSSAGGAPHANAVAIRHHVNTRMLIARNLTKEFDSGAHHLTVLRDVNFEIAQGEFIAVVGPSGSGKTTLLGLLAGLDTPTRGQVILDGTDITSLTEDARARLRGEKVGFVFQTFQLIPTLTALENVQVPLELRGERNAGARATDLLSRVGLSDRVDHLPTQLSGGEQQRVALARAFANRPRILFADEPTGNLDGTTGARIVALLEELNHEAGSTIVLVTHDLTLAERARRLIRLRDGVVVEDRKAGGNGATA